MRAKEFLSKTSIEFEPINIAGNAAGQARLEDHGFTAVPVVCVGDSCVSGVDLEAVADLVGVPYEARDMLAPPALYAKWQLVLAATIRYARQVPFENLSHASPDRDRNLRQLLVHALERPLLFIAAYETGERPPSAYHEIAADLTSDAIAALGERCQQALRQWWEDTGSFDLLDRVIELSWGAHTLHELLERETWHSAQHARQVILFLDQLAIAPDGPLAPEDLAGLPLPEHVWD